MNYAMNSAVFGFLLVITTLSKLSQSVPVSPHQRFALYTPYWPQESRSPYARDLVQKRPDCTTTDCDLRNNFLDAPSKNEFNSDFQVFKRNKNVYRTGWTMGGMPFSVLYMNPKTQMNVRSPIAESLRSLPPMYDNAELLLKEPPPPPPQSADSRLESFVHEVQAQALTSKGDPSPGPTVLPTRRQYSIIPQLFVSYGWGPLGK